MTSLSVQQRLAASRIHFWTEVVPYLQECTIQECQECVQNSTVKSEVSMVHNNLYIYSYFAMAVSMIMVM